MAIKVLQVVDRLKQVSGIAQAILNYYWVLDTDTVQFDFVSVDADEDLVRRVERRGGHVYMMPRPSIANMWTVKRWLHNFFAEHEGEYPIVHSNFYQIDFLLFSVAKRHGVSACISHSHNIRYADYHLRAIRNWTMSKLGVRKATHYVACSEEAGKFLFGKRRVAKGEVYVLKNAIDAKKFTYNLETRNRVRKQFHVESNYVVGHVGRFNKQKNHTYLLERFAEYSRTDDSAVLLLVGTGDLQASYETLAKRLGVAEKVIFLGMRTDVSELLQAMDCYVFPSIYEGLGIALVEAEAAGLPCCASLAVPPETQITDAVAYYAFDEPERWVQFMKDSKYFVRTDTYPQLCAKGYDLSTAVRALEVYYQNCSRG